MKQNNYLKRVFSILLTIAVTISIVLLLNLFYQTYQKSLVQGSVDLRNRITGTRIALEKQDPYTYTWRQTDPIEWADPYADPLGTTSRLTVSPALLLFHIPFSFLRFDQTIILWFFCEWLALLIAIFIFLIAIPQKQRKLIFFFCSIVFSLSIYWRIHIIAGQVYVFYTLVAVVSMILLKQAKTHTCAGILLGILSVARPPYLFLIVPFLLFRTQYKSVIASFCLSAIATITITGLVFGFPIWQQYIQSMVLHDGISSQNLVERTYSTDIYPQVIENVTFLKGSGLPLLEQEDSFRGSLYKYFGLHVPVSILLVLMTVFTALTIIFTHKKKDVLSTSHVFLLGMILVLIIEYLLPAKHYMYANIQWIIPLAIVIQQWKSRS